MQSCSRGLRELCRLLGYSPQAYYQYQKSSGKRALREDLLIGQILYHRIPQPRVGGVKLHEMMCPFMTEHDMYIGRDQLWVSDITYIHLNNNKFAYLSLVTDAYSRKIVGFCMNSDLSAEGPVTALEMALKQRVGDAPLIHHSDRGSQYCSDIYVSLLTIAHIDISMTQSGNPRDNAIAERVNGILKQELLEEIYPNVKQARCSAAIAIDTYNRLRPHSSVDMMTPEKAHMKTGPIKRRWRSIFNRRIPNTTV